VSVVRSTLELYGRAARKAGEALVRSPAALVSLVASQLVFFAVSTLVDRANLGLAGGFIIALAAAACVGSYLHMVDRALSGRKGAGFGDLQESLGRYLWDTLNVMFIFFLVDLVLGFILPWPLLLALWMAIFVLFNPVPELIYQGRGSMGIAGGLETLKEALRWVRKNALEWFLPQVLIAVAVALAGIDSLLAFLQAFGPRFGFVESLTTVVPLLDAMHVGWSAEIVTKAILVPLLTHAMMLFRGALFLELDGSSRRTRAWQDRFR